MSTDTEPGRLLKSFMLLDNPVYHQSWFFLISQQPLTQSSTRLMQASCNFEVNNSAWGWTASYLKGWSHQVIMRGSRSASCKLLQGSELGPLLFFPLYPFGHWGCSFTWLCIPLLCWWQLILFSSPLMFLHRSQHFWCHLVMNGNSLLIKLNPSKTDLQYIPGDASPHHDLVISLENSML